MTDWQARQEIIRDVLAVIEDHWPQIGQDQSDSTWLDCPCGWDQSVKGVVDWHQHLVNAVDDAFAFDEQIQAEWAETEHGR